MVKTVFMDIDGVLNDLKPYFGWDYEMQEPRQDFYAETTGLFTPRCVNNFNKIINDTAAHIVVSSSWRYNIFHGNMTLNGFSVMLRSHGVRGYLVDLTPEIMPQHRGREIQTYLHEHPEIKDFVILDDDEDTKDCFDSSRLVLTCQYNGLTDENADRAIEILGRAYEKDTCF